MKREDIAIPIATIAFATIAYTILKSGRCKYGNFHECCTDYCGFYYKNGRLHNNTWGKGPNEILTLCTNYYDGNGIAGWEWNRPNPIPQSSGINPLYPEIIIGKQPWDVNSTWSEFPKIVSDISLLKFDLGYNYPKRPTEGLLNLAYDVWLANSSEPSPSPIGIYAEIMVWIDCGMNCEPGIYLDDFSDGYNNYKVYYLPKSTTGVWPQWIFVAFVRQPVGVRLRQTYYNVDFKKMIDHIITRGIVPSAYSKYIHGIEFGNEINRGSGKIEINKYNIILNNKTISLMC